MVDIKAIIEKFNNRNDEYIFNLIKNESKFYMDFDIISGAFTTKQHDVSIKRDDAIRQTISYMRSLANYVEFLNIDTVDMNLHINEVIDDNYLNNDHIDDPVILFFIIYGVFLEFYFRGENKTSENGFFRDEISSEFLSSFNNNIILKSFKNEKYRKLYFYFKDVFYLDLVRFDLKISKGSLSKAQKTLDETEANIESKIASAITSLDTKLTEFEEQSKEVMDEKFSTLEEMHESINEGNDLLTFIGLDNAYKNLEETKKKEKLTAELVLFSSIFLVALPISAKIAAYYLGIKYNIFGYALTATATLILIYFFRVSLLNYNAIKTELTQVLLRRNLCMFIKGYIEFSSRNIKENKESLTRFESLIFSNIIPDDKNIPSSLDGIEQLAKLINSLKK
ncbi:TPA: hypothetical protein KEY68_000169 [Providencia rettgeri]|nr:hypothetical protein [Providencia rettgeri]